MNIYKCLGCGSMNTEVREESRLARLYPQVKFNYYYRLHCLEASNCGGQFDISKDEDPNKWNAIEVNPNHFTMPPKVDY